MMGPVINAVGKNLLPPPPIPEGMLEKVQAALESHPWTFAKSMPHCPHWWSLGKQWPDYELYKEAYLFIRTYGVVESYGKWYTRYLYAGGYKYWTMCDPEVDMNLINRAFVRTPLSLEPDPKPMMITKSYKLKLGQVAYPVLWQESVVIPDGGLFPARRALEILSNVFGDGKSKRLQTFERDPADRDGPHWIGIRSGVGLHVDPGFPRYTHQIVCYNDGWGLAGLSGVMVPHLTVGAVFQCDTHSPHQVIPDTKLGKGLFYLAASMDSQTPLPPEEVIPKLLEFVRRRANNVGV